MSEYEWFNKARRGLFHWSMFALLIAGIGIAADHLHAPGWVHTVLGLLIGYGFYQAGRWGSFKRTYKIGYGLGQEAEHYFDDSSVTNPLTGKPYGPGPLWAGSEPMDYPDPRCVCGALWLSDGSTAGQCGRFVLGREELGEYSAYMDLTYDGVPLCGQVSPPDPYGLQAERVVCTEARETHMPGIHRGRTARGVPYEWREHVT